MALPQSKSESQGSPFFAVALPWLWGLQMPLSVSQEPELAHRPAVVVLLVDTQSWPILQATGLDVSQTVAVITGQSAPVVQAMNAQTAVSLNVKRPAFGLHASGESQLLLPS
jgi:hypothetical protein